MGKRKAINFTATCNVCGDKASTHKHYGSQEKVCYSCRAFFRRCVKKKKIPVAIMCNSYLVGPGTCQIRPQTRSICRYVSLIINQRPFLINAHKILKKVQTKIFSVIKNWYSM